MWGSVGDSREKLKGWRNSLRQKTVQGRSGKTKSVKTNLQSVEKVSVLLNTQSNLQ